MDKKRGWPAIRPPAGGYDLLAPAFVLAQHGGVGVGSFHDGVIRPMLAADIREGVQLAEIVRNEAKAT